MLVFIDIIILSASFLRWLNSFDGNDWSVFYTSLYQGNFSLYMVSVMQ